jgi:hypothetical protein
MKTWKQISNQYHKYLIDKELKEPKIRLAALHKIERFLKENYPSIINGSTNFIHIDKFELRNKYELWKGKNITGAESQVFNDFYKICHL